MSIRYALVVVPALAAAASWADTPTYFISAHVVSAGTSAHASSACFGMDAVIAEPVAGFSSGGVYDLSSGFAYVSPIVNDTIFANRFEDCAP